MSAVDDEYVKRGVLLALPQSFGNWNEELTKMNSGKRGAQYEYSNPFIDFASRLKDYSGMASRVLQGFLIGLSAYIPNVRGCDHSILCRRVNTYDKPLKVQGGSTIAIDSSGLTPARRGGWLPLKHKKKQSYVKVHFAVNVKTGEILEWKVTPDNVHDNKVLPDLVINASKRKRLRKVLGDGAYDDAFNDDFVKAYGGEMITPPRRNSRVRRNPPPDKWSRNERVREFKRLGAKRWKKKHGYGARWLVETVFSVWKRLFGEFISAKTHKNVLAEIARKVAFYNTLTTM